MRKLFFVIGMLIIGFSGGLLNAQTNVSGIISSNTTWTIGGSPYIVTDNILVNSGATLTIEAGVTVKIDSGKSMQIIGELIARGTYNNRINFISNQLNPAPGDWKNIYFNDNSIDAITDSSGNYLSGSIIEYAIIEWGGGDNATGSLQILKAFPYISNCIIKNGKSNGIYAFFQVSGGPFYILNNTITANGNYGIYINDRAPLVIKGNIIKSNQGGVNFMNAGMFMGSPIIFQHNILSENGDGVSFSNAITWYQSYVDISFNSFIGNRGNNILYPISNYQNASNIKNNTFYSNNAEMLVLFDYPHLFKNNNLMSNNCKYYLSNRYTYPGASGLVDATNNWWGTTNEADIQAKIYDWLDDNNLEIINYNPYLIKPDTACPVSPPTNVTKTDIGGGNVKITLDHNPESDIAGYHVYYGGFDGYLFTNIIDIGRDTSYILTGVSIIDTIAVTAYDSTYNIANEDISTIVNDNMTNGNESWFTFAIDTSTTTGITQNGNEIPRGYILRQNYPNPFNPSTNLSFSIPSRSFVSLKVFDLTGREVATIISEEMPTGNYTRQWNVTNMASGIYFYRLSAVPTAQRDFVPGDGWNGQARVFTETKKLVLLR